MAADVKKENAIARRKRRKSKDVATETADWGSVSPQLISDLIAIVTSQGGAISFGYTRDGGAYYLSYFMDGQSDKTYIRPTEGIEDTLADEILSWQ